MPASLYIIIKESNIILFNMIGYDNYNTSHWKIRNCLPPLYPLIAFAHAPPPRLTIYFIIMYFSFNNIHNNVFLLFYADMIYYNRCTIINRIRYEKAGVVIQILEFSRFGEIVECVGMLFMGVCRLLGRLVSSLWNASVCFHGCVSVAWEVSQ